MYASHQAYVCALAWTFMLPMLLEPVLCVMFEARHSWPGFHGQTMRSQCSRQHGLAECYKWKRNRIFGCCSLCVLKFAKKLNRKCANNFLINKWKQKIKRAPVKHTYFCDSISEVRFCREGVESKSEENKQQDLEMNEMHTKQKINYRAPHSIKPPLGREGGLCFTDPLRETSFGSVWNCVLCFCVLISSDEMLSEKCLNLF